MIEILFLSSIHTYKAFIDAVDIRQLNYFFILAEELHFGRAAERLHISQPPLSRMIKQIETDLGVRLFDRTKRKVLLTAAGVELLQQTRQVMAQMDTLKKRLQIVGKGENGTLRIGYVGASMHSPLPTLLASFVSRFPLVHFHFEEQPNHVLLHSLSNGTMDVAFVRTWLHPKNLVEQLIGAEPLVVVVPAGHRLAHCQQISMPELSHETFITFARECGPTIFDNFLALCTSAGFTPHIAHHASQINSVLRLVESGFGISLLPRHVENGYRLEVKYIPLVPSSESIPFIMLFRKENSNPSLALLQSHLVNYLNADSVDN